jgi:hypothetical protein
VNTTDEPGRLSPGKLAETRAALWDLGRHLDRLMAQGASEAEMEATLAGMRHVRGLITAHLAAGAPPARRKARAKPPRLELAAA